MSYQDVGGQVAQASPAAPSLVKSSGRRSKNKKRTKDAPVRTTTTTTTPLCVAGGGGKVVHTRRHANGQGAKGLAAAGGG